MVAITSAYASKALSIVGPRLPQIKVTEVDEDENVVIRTSSQLALSSTYRYRSLPFSAVDGPN